MGSEGGHRLAHRYDMGVGQRLRAVEDSESMTMSRSVTTSSIDVVRLERGMGEGAGHIVEHQRGATSWSGSRACMPRSARR